MLSLKQISGLGRKLNSFLELFDGCFGRREPRELLRTYVCGQLSDEQRKNCEAMALRMGAAPRTLQRFLESVKWDEARMRDTCQAIVARDHAHPEAIGIIDESGTTKSGRETVGAARQYNGNRGKIDNCTVAVHLAYAAPGFQVLLDSAIYLPEDFARDAARRKKRTCPKRSCSRRSRNSRSG
jgi:SRSO17 transposase